MNMLGIPGRIHFSGTPNFKHVQPQQLFVWTQVVQRPQQAQTAAYSLSELTERQSRCAQAAPHNCNTQTIFNTKSIMVRARGAARPILPPQEKILAAAAGRATRCSNGALTKSEQRRNPNAIQFELPEHPQGTKKGKSSLGEHNRYQNSVEHAVASCKKVLTCEGLAVVR